MTEFNYTREGDYYGNEVKENWTYNTNNDEFYLKTVFPRTHLSPNSTVKQKVPPRHVPKEVIDGIGNKIEEKVETITFIQEQLEEYR